MLRTESVWIDAMAFQRGHRGLIAHENISPREQPMKDIYALRLIVVKGDGALVPIRGQEVGRLRADKRRTPGARLIAYAGTLDLDHVGAEIAKQHSAVRARKGFGEFNNLDAVEGSAQGGRL